MTDHCGYDWRRTDREGAGWVCGVCHPPAQPLVDAGVVVWRDHAEGEGEEQIVKECGNALGLLSWRPDYGWRRAGQADGELLPPVVEPPDEYFIRAPKPGATNSAPGTTALAALDRVHEQLRELYPAPKPIVEPSEREYDRDPVWAAANPGPHRPACCCADGGAWEDGRCARCWGWPR
jgi:hypothetical protein